MKKIIFIGAGASSLSAIQKLYRKHSVILIDTEIENIQFNENRVILSKLTIEYDYLVIGDYSKYNTEKIKRINNIFIKNNLSLTSGKVSPDFHYSVAEFPNVYFINQAIGLYFRIKPPFDYAISFQLGRFVANNILHSIKGDKTIRYFRPKKLNCCRTLVKLYLNDIITKVHTYL